MDLFLMLLWIGCGVAAAMLASRKGRSGCGGFALGFILGPIGLVIVLLLRSNQDAIDAKNVSTGDKMICPYCAEVIKAAAVKCRYCRSDITTDATVVEQEAPENPVPDP